MRQRSLITGPDELIRRRWLAAGLFGAAVALPGRGGAVGTAVTAGPDASRSTVVFPGATTAITLSEALKERCSLRSFGAKLDGTTDDSTAVARAVEYARAAHRGGQVGERDRQHVRILRSAGRPGNADRPRAVSANLSADTRGPLSVIGPGAAAAVDAASGWDKPGPPPGRPDVVPHTASG